MTRAPLGAALLSMALAACSRPAGPAGPPEDEVWVAPGARGQLLVDARRQALPQSVAGAGRIAFHDLHVAHVFSPVTGRVTRVIARPGERVRKGTPLVAILSPDVGSAFADVVKAQADLELATAEDQRQRRLAGVKAASQHDVELAEDALRRAHAEYDRVRERARLLRRGSVDEVTQEYVLRSFIDGEVISRQVNPGVEVQGQYSGGQPAELFTIGDIHRVWVMADVQEQDLARVRLGSDVVVRVAAYPGRTFTGKVDWISSTLDPALRTGKVRSEVANDDAALKPEMLAQVSIATAPRQALAIPRAAVTREGGQAFVHARAGALADGRVVMKRRLVRIRDDGGELVEVTDGLAEGEPVLVEEGPVPSDGTVEARLTSEQVAAAGIEAIPVDAGVVPDAVTLGGRLAFDDLSVTHVFSPITGRVTRVIARPGQRVKRGAPLVAIQSPDVGVAVADVVKAEADATQAQHEATRQRELVEAHAGARRNLEAAENALAKARAELDRARQKARLLRTGSFDRVTQEYVLTSPLDGEVVARNVNPGAEVQGQYSGASSPVELFTIGASSRLIVLADAYEVDLPRLHEGDRVAIHLAAYPDRTFDGRLEWVSDALDPVLHTARVRCRVENPDGLLKPEMYESVTVEVPGREVLAVPRTALLRSGEDVIVFVDRGTARDGKRVFERRAVTADEGHRGALVPISGAVHPGERVVTRGAIFVLGSL